MLPFLKAKIQPTTVIEQRKPDQTEDENEAPDHNEGLHMAASDLIDAIHNKDIKAAASAMRAAFDVLEMEPHDEVEHNEEEEE